MTTSPALTRRSLLRAAVAASAAPALATPALATPALATPALATPALAAPAFAAPALAPSFVTDYRTNVMANLTAETNAVVRILSGMQRLWHTGSTWDTGTVLDEAVLRANIRYSVKVTRNRTQQQADRAFVQDRQHQSYAVIAGLGPLAAAYKAQALAVTSITTAPATTPATTISDTVPAGAPAGSAVGAGSPDSATLGAVVTLVNTVRGPFASGNPAKAAFQYPRPWRMNNRSEVVPTGEVDALGYPVYDSEVSVVPTLLRQRSLTPADDGGFPSGHTNAFHLAALAFAYAFPERFQELVTAAFDLSDTRIIAGMHSAVDVIGGRIMATALAAAALNDPANADLKAAAREQARQLQRKDTPTAVADAYADRRANRRKVESRLTYGLPRGRAATAMTVPQGAEVLLETRQPYLTAAQRREVLRTTALPAGYPLLDGPENWGRLDLFAAADGYGAFDRDVHVTMDGTTTDTWRNDIGGRGGLVKAGAGTLVLDGTNSYRGGTTVTAGILSADSRTALGTGPVMLTGGTLRTATTLHLHGDYRQQGGTLAPAGPITVDGTAVLGHGSALEIKAPSARTGTVIQILTAHRVTGRFTHVTVTTPGYRAEAHYTRTGVAVVLRRA
ncbi:phosphatase PAP2 family protein [Actinoplanes sp. NPDC051494]|uniref:phosphatase PAP2 family protein n=1 Tax=Actinoplanes sp. NPDC051494 TaxID=3363907 RepID=UPI00379F22B1